MRKNQSILALTVLSITIISLFAAAAQSQPGQVWVSDSSDPSDPPVPQSYVGQTVYIHYKGFLSTATISINHTTGVIDHKFQAYDTGYGTYEPQEPGEYDVWVGVLKICEFAATSFIVVPEVLLGSLGAVGAASAAGLVYYRRKRR